MKEELKQLLTKSKYDQKTLNELICSLETVFKFQESNKKIKLNSFEKEVKDNLNKIKDNLIQLQLQFKKNASLLSYFKLDKQTENLQNQIKQQLLDLQKQVQSQQQSINCDIDTINLDQFQVLELNHIRSKLQFILYHPKYQPIAIIIEFLIFESNQQNEYQMVIQQDYLIQKFQQYYEKQQTHIHKLKNQDESALFTLKYNSSEKQLILQVENNPYFITSNLNQSKIYLDKDMILIFDDFLQLKVNQTNTQNNKKQFLSTFNTNNVDNSQKTIQVNGYGYIQFEIINLNNKKVEFYLKNSYIDLSKHLLGIQAILKHDENGFTIIPKPNGDPYKILYDKKLISQDSSVNVGIQLSNKFWIEVELDKQKSDQFLFD
ncbi:unnamed protein product [Paramecium pentaurelia]|uniref:Uncharacterized protein n=1 Tax=Paramecium pentaurelia TaxID=43138 RepID=A0A8S1V261_9CILI|nr:unnamed protein product [Paramecium pentaurelia]